jgi:site-specific DNA recombinase
VAVSNARRAAQLEELDEAGVALCSATEPIDTQGPVGRRLLQLLRIFAEFERDLLIDRIESGFECKASRGEWLGGRPPFDYSLDSANKTLIPEPTEEALVRSVYTKFDLEHLGSTTITRWLNDNGGRTRSGTPWTNQRVLRMLHNGLRRQDQPRRHNPRRQTRPDRTRQTRGNDA